VKKGLRSSNSTVTTIKTTTVKKPSKNIYEKCHHC
jgi:hypothetical protein